MNRRLNWRNVLPFGVPETTLEVFASFASAIVVGVVGAILLVTLFFWAAP